MPISTRRSILMTAFGVVGLLWFLLHAVEYIYSRYDALQTMLPLPSPLGLVGLFEGMPQWAEIALTAAIWLGLLGAILLVLRDQAAVLILALTFLATLPVLVWAVISFAQGLGALGGVAVLMFAGGQVAVALGLWLYARTAKRYGVF